MNQKEWELRALMLSLDRAGKQTTSQEVQWGRHPSCRASTERAQRTKDQAEQPGCEHLARRAATSTEGLTGKWAELTTLRTLAAAGASKARASPPPVATQQWLPGPLTSDTVPEASQLSPDAPAHPGLWCPHRREPPAWC